MVRQVRQPTLAESPPQPSRPSSSLGTAVSRLPVAGSRIARPRTVLKERGDQNKRPAPSTSYDVPLSKRKTTNATKLSVKPSATTLSRGTLERSLSPVAAPPLTGRPPKSRGVRVPAGASPHLSRAEETMIWDVAPPADMPSSSAFGGDDSDNEPGPSRRTPRGRGVPGAGRLMTPSDSLETFSLTGRRPSTSSRSVKQRVPTPKASRARVIEESPPEPSRIQARDSLSPPHRLKASRRRLDTVSTDRDEEPNQHASPQRKRPRTSPPIRSVSAPQTMSKSPSTVKASRTLDSTSSRTPHPATLARTSSKQIPATAPAKRQVFADADPRLSTPITFRPSETPITPSMRRETTSFKRGLSPNARELLRGVFVGTSDTALQPEPGDDPILLMAERRASMPKSARRSSKSKRKSTGKRKSMTRPEDGDLAAYGDDTVAHIPSDAFDGPEDTFAAMDRRDGGHRRPPSMLRAQRLSSQLQAQTANDERQDDEQQPANQNSPFVHRAERAKFSPSEGPGLSSLSRLVALDRAASPSGSEATARGAPSPDKSAAEPEINHQDDYDNGYFVHDMPSPSLSPEPFFQAPTPDDSDAEVGETEPAQQPEQQQAQGPSIAATTVQDLLAERRMAAARRTVSASPFSRAGSAVDITSPIFTDEVSDSGRKSKSATPTPVVAPFIRPPPGVPLDYGVYQSPESGVSDRFSSRAASEVSEAPSDRTARGEDMTAQPVPSPRASLRAPSESRSAQAVDDVQDEDADDEAESPAAVVSEEAQDVPEPPARLSLSVVPSAPTHPAMATALQENTSENTSEAENHDQGTLSARQASPVGQAEVPEVHFSPEQQLSRQSLHDNHSDTEHLSFSPSHLSTLAAEFLDGFSSDEEDAQDVADEEHTAMMLLESSPEKTTPREDALEDVSKNADTSAEASQEAVDFEDDTVIVAGEEEARGLGDEVDTSAEDSQEAVNFEEDTLIVEDEGDDHSAGVPEAPAEDEENEEINVEDDTVVVEDESMEEQATFNLEGVTLAAEDQAVAVPDERQPPAVAVESYRERSSSEAPEVTVVAERLDVVDHSSPSSVPANAIEASPDAGSVQPARGPRSPTHVAQEEESANAGTPHQLPEALPSTHANDMHSAQTIPPVSPRLPEHATARSLIAEFSAVHYESTTLEPPISSPTHRFQALSIDHEELDVSAATIDMGDESESDSELVGTGIGHEHVPSIAEEEEATNSAPAEIEVDVSADTVVVGDDTAQSLDVSAITAAAFDDDAADEDVISVIETPAAPEVEQNGLNTAASEVEITAENVHFVEDTLDVSAATVEVVGSALRPDDPYVSASEGGEDELDNTAATVEVDASGDLSDEDENVVVAQHSNGNDPGMPAATVEVDEEAEFNGNDDRGSPALALGAGDVSVESKHSNGHTSVAHATALQATDDEAENSEPEQEESEDVRGLLTPPRFGIEKIVQAAWGTGMVVDGAALQVTEDAKDAVEDGKDDVDDNVEEVSGGIPQPSKFNNTVPLESQTTAVQRTPSPPAHQQAERETLPALDEESDLPLRLRRKMDAGSTPVRPRKSASQQPASPLPPSPVAKLVLESSPRRSPRLNTVPVAEPASPVRRSARLSRGASPLAQLPMSPLKATVTPAAASRATPLREMTPAPNESSAVLDEAAPAQSHEQASYAVSAPQQPEPAAVEAPAQVDAAHLSSTENITSTSSHDQQPAFSPLQRLSLSPVKSPLKTPVSITVFTARVTPNVDAAVPHHPPLFDSPAISRSPATDVAEPPASEPAPPPSPRVAITAPSSDADSDIGADDTMEGDSDAWNLTAAELTFDAQDVTANSHFAAHRFAGEAWDVTRIEREASAGPSTRAFAKSPSHKSPQTERLATRSLSAQPRAPPTPSPTADDSLRAPSTRDHSMTPRAASRHRSRTPVPNGAQAAFGHGSDHSARQSDVTADREGSRCDKEASDEDEGIESSEEEEEDDGRIVLKAVTRIVKVEPEDDEAEELRADEPVSSQPVAARTRSATPSIESRRLSSPIALQQSPAKPVRQGAPSTSATELAQLEPTQPRAIPSVLRYAPPSFQNPSFQPQLPLQRAQAPPQSTNQSAQPAESHPSEPSRHRRQPSTRPAVPSALSREVPLDSPHRSLQEELSLADDEGEIDDTFRSVVEVSSLDPRAAARAAAILKMNHRYIEHGILDATVGNISRMPETPFTAGERTEVYESMETELRKQRLLHDAELDLVMRERTRSASVFTTMSTTDSPLHIPGAWRKTPKRKRHVEETPRPHKPEVVPGVGRAWRGKDWRRLHRTYRVERAKWVSEREVRPLPGSSWTPFRRAAVTETIPWDHMRIVDAFIKARGVKEAELVGEWSRNVIANRVAGIEARYGDEPEHDKSEPSAKHARTDPSPAPPSTVKRMLDWVWGLGTTKTPQATKGRVVSGEMERAERGESRSPHFIHRNDETVDFDVTMATPSRAVDTASKRQGKRPQAPAQLPDGRPMRQLPNIARVEGTPRRSRSRSRRSPSGRSPSAPPLRSPSPEQEPTQLEADEYRYGRTTKAFPALYPSLPDHSISDRSVSNRTYDRSINQTFDRTSDRLAALSAISGTPRPKARIRSVSGPNPLPPLHRSRDPPNVRNLVKGFEETSRLDMSFESERREREKDRLRSLRRVKSTVEQLRDSSFAGL